MDDMIVKGSGNSRFLRTVANALTLYPTYEDMIAAMVAGTFPIDLNGINPAGVEQMGTKLGKASLLKDATAILYGKTATAVPDDILNLIAANLPWTLIKAYKSAGSFTFTVPANTRLIGVYMVGGGGSGGAAISGRYSAIATGGASGYGRNLVMSVTPGQQIQLVVGVGGEAITTSYSSDGKVGGTTSFGGVTVLGGNGGSYNTGNNIRLYQGALGGQPSDGAVGSGENRKIYGCVPAKARESSYGTNDYLMPPYPARVSQNAFDPTMVTLCAGGVAGQTIEAMPDGTRGGTAGFPDATGNGNGGAGVALGNNSDSSITSVTSGAGSPGMVLIYRRGVA